MQYPRLRMLTLLSCLAGCHGGETGTEGDARVDAAIIDAAIVDGATVDGAILDGAILDGSVADSAIPDASVDTTISIVGRQLRIGGVPFQIKGVCWNPVTKGKTHPAGIDFAGTVAADAALMKAAGINVVRTYEMITSRAVLDTLYAHGIYVLQSVYPYGGTAVSEVKPKVHAVVDHPAILMWLVGNEWNYNGLYVGMSHADSLARLNEVAALIREEDSVRPIATIYGEVPAKSVVDAMPLINIWGLNVYRGIGFGDLFDVWATRSTKPMFVSEYGADAWNANANGGAGAYDPTSQGQATTALTQSILDHASATDTNDVCVGGTIFEWSDEWWKDNAGMLNVHDVGGIAPGGGPYPDQTFNEEWWGIVDIDRNVRPAYDALKALYAP